MADVTFDFAEFCTLLGAPAREMSALRQDLVRGLKDYYESVYGYDRYGAETIFQISRRLGQPYVYGFALQRILRDRRISPACKRAAAHLALDRIQYGADQGLPRGLFGALGYLNDQSDLSTTDLRYALVASAGEMEPFHGLDRRQIVSLFSAVIEHGDISTGERLFWGHSLAARHREQVAAADVVTALLSAQTLPIDGRRELCRAWLHQRQPRIEVPSAVDDVGGRASFVSEHLPFWVAHAPSWPSVKMMHAATVWLPKLGEEPLGVAVELIQYRGLHAEHVYAGVADVLLEYGKELPAARVRDVIEQGIGVTGSSPTRRRFYLLGAQLFGDEYLERASTDTAGSVRQWASKRLHPPA